MQSPFTTNFLAYSIPSITYRAIKKVKQEAKQDNHNKFPELR